MASRMIGRRLCGMTPNLLSRLNQTSYSSLTTSLRTLNYNNNNDTTRVLRRGSTMNSSSNIATTTFHPTKLWKSFSTEATTNERARGNDGPASSSSMGEEEKYSFEAETKEILNIVARSLYSDKHVFIRELISNASDAIEKFRYLITNNQEGLIDPSRELSIQIDTDKISRTLTISDNGIGMNKQEMIQNLGTIARSGSKAFLKELESKGDTDSRDIIGQFGVGFYSAFMVADKIEVISKSSSDDSAPPHRWISDGSGSYTISEVSKTEVTTPGTKIIIHLKDTCGEFADENNVRDVIKKYSSFVGSSLSLNQQKANDLKPLWLMEPKEVTEDMHHDFYHYISNAYDKPRFTQHYRAEAPIDIRALLYVPESRPGLFETNREAESGISLYCRKVLIKSGVNTLVPTWMRFVKGVVDSEDIPLNLSREMLQDSAQIRKLRTVISNKFLRFMQDRARKDTKSFNEFYKDYGFFFKEGIITAQDQVEKEELAKLLRFESSSMPEGEQVSIPEYASRMREGQQEIYYLAAPSRQLAENSPYFEALNKKDVEILFCYESYDELVLMQLQQFDKKKVISVEKEMRNAPEPEQGEKEDSLSSSDQDHLANWMKDQLGPKCSKIKVTNRLQSHPCVITVEEMAAARHFIKTQGANFNEDQRYNILQPQLEINPSHPVIKKLNDIKSSNPKLAHLVTEQIFVNAMVSAGLVEDPRTILKNMNELLQLSLDKH